MILGVFYVEKSKFLHFYYVFYTSFCLILMPRKIYNI